MHAPANPGADRAARASGGPMKRTTDPIVTGTSVLGVKFDGGVMLAADTLGSYGRLARFTKLERILKVNEDTIIGASGEYSDLQYIQEILRDLASEDFAEDDGICCRPSEVYHYLARVLYYRRCKVNPLYNQIVVAGFRNSQPFLGYTDLFGSAFEDDIIATGLGAHMALPLMRDATAKAKLEGGRLLSKAEAWDLMQRVAKVLLYRDCNTINRYQFATVTAEGVAINPPVQLKGTVWDLDHFKDPKHQYTPAEIAAAQARDVALAGGQGAASAAAAAGAARS